MADFYADMRTVAANVLKEFKQGTVQYIAVTPGSGRVDDPGAGSEVPHEVDAAVRGVQFKFVNGTTIVTTDLQATFAASDAFKPEPTGFMVVDNVRYKIVQAQPIPAAGPPVAWVVIFRK